MHRIELNAQAAKLWSLTEGPGTYYADDANTGEALIMNLGRRAQHVPAAAPPDWAPYAGMLPPEKILIVSPGGYGDIIMLTAVLHALHVQQPGVEIHVACLNLRRPLLRYLGFNVTLHPYPVPAAVWRSFADRDQPIVSLEGLIEGFPDIHPCEAFARALNLRALTKPKPIIRLAQPELEEAHHRHPRLEGEKRLGLQVRASANCRSWPSHKLVTFAQVALADGWRVFLFGAPGEFIDPPQDKNRPPGMPRKIVNLTGGKHPPDFRQSCAIMTTCDIIVAPDSALIHAAGALDLPAIALYGPFDYKVRTGIYPTVKNIQGHARCAPCNHHVRGGHEWPMDGPCQHTGACQAMEDIDPARVLKGVNAMLQLIGEQTLPA